MKRIFGTDGVRGIVNEDLTPELTFRLGKVYGWIIHTKYSTSCRVLIGRDTRLSCGMLESALSAGLTSQGVNVHLIGVIPTPGLAFLTRTEGFNAGAMISASHNLAEYNGIKFFSQYGFKLTDEDELQIEKSLSEYEKNRKIARLVLSCRNSLIQ